MRDRQQALNHILSWNDDMFQRQMRLKRVDFYEVLEKISPCLEKNEQMATLSSGSTICPLLRLAITCRILAGASYLDIDWYQINVNSVMSIVYETCEAINSQIHNIYPPTEEEPLLELAHDWMSIQVREG